MSLLCFRILVQHLNVFKRKSDDVVWHIPSKFTSEMSNKSEVVSKKIMCIHYS